MSVHPDNESQVRALRSKIYGECSDGNWNACKDKWMLKVNVAWLIETLKRQHLIKD